MDNKALALVLDAMFDKVNSFESEEDLREFLKNQGAKTSEELFEEIQQAVREVRMMVKRAC